MKPTVFAIALLSLLGCSDHQAHEVPEPAPAGTNPVQNEMRLLTTALEATVRGIGQGDVRSVEHALHRVHSAKAATDQAIESGRYRLPRNHERLGDFRALDAAFHRDLEQLVEASRGNDVGGAGSALGVVLTRCEGCHRDFRQ